MSKLYNLLELIVSKVNNATYGLANSQPKGDYALKKDIPTKVSQLTNDSGYLTEIPDSGGDANEVSVEPTEEDIPKVFFGSALPQTKDDTVMSFRYVSKTEDIKGYCKTKAQGSSSMGYPKKNQTVKLYSDADCTEKLNVDFKGWGEQNKFCFKANWIDLTHARNVVSARLWGDVVSSRANSVELPELLKTSPNYGAIDGFPVKVYAAGVYQGRYTLNIPKGDWMANLNDELDTHCILCGESNADDRCLFRATASINGTDWTDEVHDTVPDTIKARWNDIIYFVLNSTDDEFKANLSQYFYVDSLIDYYLFGLASCGLDAFGKNQLYMTYDGQKWFATMYDLDSTWGLWWNGTSFVSTLYRRDEYQDYKDGNGNLLYIRLESLFWDEIKVRWEELKNGALRVDNIVNRFERFTDIAPTELIEEDYAETTAEGAFTGIPLQETNNIQQIRAYAVARLAYAESVINPTEYTVVDYIESTGTQYIDTGILNEWSAEYEIVFTPMSGSVNWGFYFGQNTWRIPALQVNRETLYLISSLGSKTIPITLGEQLKITYNLGSKLTINDEAVDLGFDCGDNGWWSPSAWVFCSASEPTLFSNMRLHSLKMWTRGELVRDFLPVIRNSDGVACLYDKVTQTFFENSGTGEFIVPG